MPTSLTVSRQPSIATHERDYAPKHPQVVVEIPDVGRGRDYNSCGYPNHADVQTKMT